MEIKKFIDHLDRILGKIEPQIQICLYIIDHHNKETGRDQFLTFDGMLSGLRICQDHILSLKEELYKDKEYGKKLDNTC